MEKKRRNKNEIGITLIALIMTVIIMLILAGVAISVLTSDGGLFEKTQGAADIYIDAAQNEVDQMTTLMNEIDNYLGNVSTNPEDDTPFIPVTDGSWDSIKKIHTPKLVSGMTPIYWDNNGIEKELIVGISTKSEWEQWYSYTRQIDSTATVGSGTSKWANAVTKNNTGEITGYWVWIPRYEYLLTVPVAGENAGTIAVNFIEIGDTATENYKIHPAFTTNTSNGGWTSDIPGFWVAKYPAGFQESTVDSTGTLLSGQDTNNVQYSGLKYTTPGNVYTNALGQTLNNPADTTVSTEIDTNISYPVFKPLTYVYNAINIDGSYRISKEIANATSFYGMSSTNVDSHLMKNSEWGAIAYLTWSDYGRNATEPNINNINLNNKDSKTIYAVTGMYASANENGDGTNNTHTNGNFVGSPYNTGSGQLGSSTGNITGVYDLNGCVWERVSGYIENSDGSKNRNNYAASILSAAAKYKTIYSSGDESTITGTTDEDNNNKRQLNYAANSVTSHYGDAILETSSMGYGENSWNKASSYFPSAAASFIVYKGSYKDGQKSGIFAFSSNTRRCAILYRFSSYTCNSIMKELTTTINYYHF